MKKTIIAVTIAAGLLSVFNAPINVHAKDFKTNSIKSSYSVNKDMPGFFQLKYSDDKFATPFKKIPNTNYEVSLVGKGENAQEEGKASILINKQGRYFQYIFNGKTNNQLTPLKVVDGYDNNLIVLVGNGWGSMQSARYIFSLDVENGITTLLYSSDKDYISDAKINNNKLNIKKFSISDIGNKGDEYNTTIDFNKNLPILAQVDPSESLKHSDFNTPLKKIPYSTYQGSIAGKGEYGIEEGIGSLLVKDEATNKYYEYKYRNTGGSQYCPLKIIRGNGDNVWIIVGGAYGTMPNGKYIYSLNAKAGNYTLIYTEKGPYSIADAKVEGNKLHIKNFDYETCKTFEKTVDLHL